MTEALKFVAESRTTLGTGSARAARRADRIPAVVYGSGKEAIHVTLPRKEFTLAANKSGFKATVVTLVVDGKEIKALPHSMQFHPVTDVITHVDLQNVVESGEMRVFIPTKFINKDKSPGIKRGGILNIVRREIEFFVDAKNIPSVITIDLEGSEIARSVHINDITLPAGIRPVLKRNFTIYTLLGKGGKAAAEEAAEDATAAAAVPSAADAKAATKAAAKPDAKK